LSFGSHVVVSVYDIQFGNVYECCTFYQIGSRRHHSANAISVLLLDYTCVDQAMVKMVKDVLGEACKGRTWVVEGGLKDEIEAVVKCLCGWERKGLIWVWCQSRGERGRRWSSGKSADLDMYGVTSERRKMVRGGALE
jgi:hypothetical protein